MTRALVVLNRVCGVGALVLGLAVWLGYGRSWIGLHMSLGIGVVVTLWALAVLAWRNGAGPGLPGLALIWGALVWFLGMSQSSILPGASHWVIRVTHLLVGGIAIGLGGRLARGMVRSPQGAQP